MYTHTIIHGIAKLTGHFFIYEVGGYISVKNYLSFKLAASRLDPGIKVIAIDPSFFKLKLTDDAVSGKSDIRESGYHFHTISTRKLTDDKFLILHSNKTSNGKLPETTLHEIASLELKEGQPSFTTKPRLFIDRYFPTLKSRPYMVPDFAELHRSLKSKYDMGLSVRNRDGSYENTTIKCGSSPDIETAILKEIKEKYGVSQDRLSFVDSLSDGISADENALEQGIETGSVASVDLVTMELKGREESLKDLKSMDLDQVLCNSLVMKASSASQAMLHKPTKSASLGPQKPGSGDKRLWKHGNREGTYSYEIRREPRALKTGREIKEFVADSDGGE